MFSSIVFQPFFQPQFLVFFSREDLERIVIDRIAMLNIHQRLASYETP